MLLFRVPSRRRRSTEAPSKHAQSRADRAGIEPGTFRRKPVPPDQETKPPRSPEPPKKQKQSSLCEPAQSKRASTSSKSKNPRQIHQARARNTTQNARGQKSPTHFVRACAVETLFDIKQEHESAVNTLAKRSRTERAPQSGTKAFSLTVRTPLV